MTQDDQPKLSKRDLFSDSTMTFGEHLEELRVCLFKAVYGLAIGFVIGLLVGDKVVQMIQTPLTEALTSYYQNQAGTWAENLAKEAGSNLPLSKEQIKEMVEEQGLLPEQYFVDPDVFANIEQQALDAEKPDDLIALFQQNAPFSWFPDTEKPDDPSAPAVESQPADENPEAKVASAPPPKLVPVILWHKTKDDPRIRVKGLNAHEVFVIWLKASLVVGLLIASPWIFYQVWAFVATGLYPHERRYIHIFLPVSVLLFMLGAVGAFTFVFKPVLDFLFGFNQWMGIDPDPRISEWMSFVLILPLGFGVSFQLPLVMLFLERIRVFTVEMYISKWRIAVLAIAVLSMFLTPADPYSMLLMSVPLTFLYFLGVLLCKYMPKIRKPHEVYEDDEDFD